MTLIDEREGQGGERGVSVCFRGGSGCRQGHSMEGEGGVAESRGDQEKERFESLSDFLLPLLRSGHKLI